jgi:TolA-binding protein
LFLSGHLPRAAAAYQEALKRTEPNNVVSAKDRCWILFQIGNCLRAADPATAARMYRQLISEYPHSQWAQAAKAQDQLVEWFQKDNPKTLIVDSKR